MPKPNFDFNPDAEFGGPKIETQDFIDFICGLNIKGQKREYNQGGGWKIIVSEKGAGIRIKLVRPVGTCQKYHHSEEVRMEWGCGDDPRYYFTKIKQRFDFTISKKSMRKISERRGKCGLEKFLREYDAKAMKKNLQ